MRTILFFWVVTLLIAPSCRVKQKSYQEMGSKTRIESVGRYEVQAVYGSALEAVRHIVSIDSLHIVISDYRTDGSLARKTEIDRRRQTESRDSTRRDDSLQASQRGQYELEATGDAASLETTSADAEPYLGVPWWSWVIVAIALSSAFTLMIKKKVWK